MKPLINWEGYGHKDKLHPRLVKILDAFQEKKTSGIDWAFLETLGNPNRGGIFYIPEPGVLGDYEGGFRTWMQQNLLHSQGRTRARFSESLHVWGLAFDLINSYYGYSWDWKGRDGVSRNFSQLSAWEYTGIPAWFRSQGMAWGGDWQDYPDLAHFELSGVRNPGEAYLLSGGKWWEIPAYREGFTGIGEMAEALASGLGSLRLPLLLLGGLYVYWKFFRKRRR
jgi:hypothetical protein